MVPAGYGWQRTRGLGTRLAKWNRVVQRCAFSGLVFLGTFGVVAYGLWKLGAPLQMGVIESGKMPDVAWLPPVTLVWAALSYLVLLTNTRKRGRCEGPS